MTRCSEECDEQQRLKQEKLGGKNKKKKEKSEKRRKKKEMERKSKVRIKQLI